RHTRSTRDWSSDVCSSDLGSCLTGAAAPSNVGCAGQAGPGGWGWPPMGLASCAGTTASGSCSPPRRCCPGEACPSHHGGTPTRRDRKSVVEGERGGAARGG